MPDEIVIALCLAFAFALITAVGRLARAHPGPSRRRPGEGRARE
jgi:hypothetical protein